MLGSYRVILSWVGLLILGLLTSGCVYTSQEQQDRRYSGRYGDPSLDGPRGQQRWERRKRRTRRSRRYRRTRRAYRKYAVAARKYRRVIMYCRFNRNKTMRIIQRLRRSMYDTENVGEWRAYKRMQRSYRRYLKRYQVCIRRFKRRLARVRRKQRAYKQYLRRKRRFNRGRMYAQRGPLWQKPPTTGRPVNPGVPANPKVPVNPKARGPLNAPPEPQPPEPPMGSNPGAKTPLMKKSQPKTTVQPKVQAQPKAKVPPAKVPPSFPVYRPPSNQVAPKKAPTNPAPKTKKPKSSLGQAIPSTPGIDDGRPSVNQPPAVGPVNPQGPNQQVVPSPKQARPAPLPKPEPVRPMSPSDRQAISRWRSYCASEVRKYPMVQALKSLGRKTIKNQDMAAVNIFKHTTSESLSGVQGSGQRFVVLGSNGRYSQAHCTDRVYQVWDTQKQKMQQIQPAVTSYFLKNRYLLPWFMGKKHSSVEEELVSYNPMLQRGGLMLRVPVPALTKRYRYQYLVWDVKSNRIVRAWTLGMPGCHSAYRSIGTDPYGRTFYYLQSERAVFGACKSKRPSGRATRPGTTYYHRLMALNLTNGERRTVARFAPSMSRLEAIVPTRDFTRIAVVQYTEMKGSRGNAYVIDTTNGKVARVDAPVTPYGVTFTPDRQYLMIYSSKGGQLHKISLVNGQRKTFKTFRLGHAMGLSADGKRLSIVFHSGIEVRDATTLKRIKFIPHKPMMGKSRFVHVGGSAVLGGTLFVKNGEKLYIRRAP